MEEVNPELVGEFLKTLFSGALQSDHALLIVFAIFAFRFLIKHHEGVVRDSKADREKYENNLRGIIGEQNEILSKVTLALDHANQRADIFNQLLAELNQTGLLRSVPSALMPTAAAAR